MPSFNYIRVYVSLFFRPLLLVIVGICALNSVNVVATQPVFAPFANLAAYGILGIFALAACMFLHATWFLIKSELGIGESCHYCGMPVRYVSPGRYGPYYHCISCGSNRSASK